MKLEFKRWFWGTIVIIVALGIISSMIGMFSMTELPTSFKFVFGGVYFLFLPGFILSYIFFSKTKKKDSKMKGAITWLERIALSIGLSLIIVPVIVFYLSLIGVKLNLLNSFFTNLGIIIFCVLILVYNKKK